MRPTVNDIARAAGVSLATVDRVLNARPGVRKVTIERVNKAIEELGYVRDLSAANLARRRTYRFVFVLTEGDSQFQHALRETIEEVAQNAARERMAVETVLVPPGDPHHLARVLHGLEDDRAEGVAIMAPETPHVRDAIRHLKENGIAVVSLVSDLPNTDQDHFVGIDSIAAGRTAGVLMRRFLCKNKGKVLVLSNTMILRESVERRLGFDAALIESYPEIEVLPSIEWRDDPDRLERNVRAAFASYDDIIGVYVTGSGNRLFSRVLAPYRQDHDLVYIAHELTEHTRAGLADGSIDVVITQDIGHVVRSTLRVLRAKVDKTEIDAAQERIRIDIVLRENMG